MRTRRERQLEGWLSNIESEFRALKASWRWRVGHRLVSLIERVLMRRPVPLAVDRIENILQAFNDARHEVLLEELRGGHDSSWQPAAQRPGRPVDALTPVLQTTTEFAAAVKHCIEIDPLQGKQLEAALAEADQALAQQLRDLSETDPPLVSIIMPTWQRGELVGQAIRSVIEQSYGNWELLVCDDGSTDDTRQRISEIDDTRIRYLGLAHAGAAAARNAGLAASQGEILCYLDSDNLWHPHYLDRIVLAYLENPGVQAVACNYLDVEFDESGPESSSAGGPESNGEANGQSSLKIRDRWIDYSWERLAESNCIDLNSFSHRRGLYEAMGGFTGSLPRRQDWDFVLKLLFRFDPLVIDEPLCLYRRNPDWHQLTHTAADQTEQATQTIAANLERYYSHGVLKPGLAPRRRRVTVVVWDVCRNHLAKAWNVAEALSEHYETQLIGFRFFGEEIFPPYRDAEPAFETRFFDGGDFPGFAETLGEVLLEIKGDIIYCVKPRLPSFGLALLANYHFGTPFICESNDLESGVTRPGEARLEAQPPTASERDFLQPWHDRWTIRMEQLLAEWPYKATHNSVHDAWLGGGCFRVMNLKDESAFTPRPGLREQTRKRLGLAEDEFVLLFAGLPRRHKGIFEALDFVRAQSSEPAKTSFPSFRGSRSENPEPRDAPANPDSPTTTGRGAVRLLVVGSRASPEYRELEKQAGQHLKVIEPQDRNAMAEINAAADAVLLWLNPATEASHHQMPFKMTDALAMQVPVLASPVGDLAELARRELVVRVPFGDTHALSRAIDEIRHNPEATRARTERARRYYLRRFTYRAMREQFAVIEREIGYSGKTHPVATRFARELDDYLGGFGS